MHSDARFSEGFSFDDVLIKPRRSNVLPSHVDLTTQFTRNVPLNIPVVSAGMDTVTEVRLAIAIALVGGIGVVHKNLSIDEQALEIDTVKRSQQGIITNPFTLHPENPVQDAEALMARYHASGVPITDHDGKLVGILTNRDLRFQEDWQQPIAEVMTSEGLVTVPPGTTLEEAKTILHQHRIEKLPIVEDDGTVRERAGADLPHPEPPDAPGVQAPRTHQGVAYRDVFARLEDGSWLHLSLAHRGLPGVVPTVLAALVLILLAVRVRRRAEHDEKASCKNKAP